MFTVSAVRPSTTTAAALEAGLARAAAGRGFQVLDRSRIRVAGEPAHSLTDLSPQGKVERTKAVMARDLRARNRCLREERRRERDGY